MAGEGGGCGHDRAYEMRAAVLALAALEIAIAGAGAALVGRQDVDVHADTHAAASVEPLETGGGENLIQAFFFGLRLDAPGAGNNQCLLDVFCDVLAFDEMCGGAQIVEARIRARADEHAVHGNIYDGRAGFQAHVFESTFRSLLIIQILEVVRIGDARGDAGNHAGIGAPGDLGSDLLGVELDGHVEFRAVVTLELLPTRDSFLERFTARDKWAAFEIRESGFIGRNHAGARAAFDGHVAHGHAAVHGKGPNGFAAIFGDMAVAAADANLSNDGEN